MRCIYAAEKSLRDRLVAAFREIASFEIAAADVNARGHVGRPPGQRLIGGVNVKVDELVGVPAFALGALAQPRVAQHGDGDLVELDVWAASLAQAVNFLPEYQRQIGEELARIRIDLRIGEVAASIEMHGRGSR